MALSAAESAEVSDRIIKFIGEFGSVLAHYYAAGVAYSERHPQNINNELRNAVTHMSRALVAPNIQEARNELDAADRHIERFKRDCLKVAVIYAGRNVSQMHRHAEITYGRVDPNLALESYRLGMQKYQIIIDEIRGDPDAAQKWERLLRDIERLRERLLKSYRLLDTKKYWVPVSLFKLWRGFKTVSAALVLALAGSALWAVMEPDQESFGARWQSKVLGLVHIIWPAPAANIPSTGAKQDAQERR